MYHLSDDLFFRPPSSLFFYSICGGKVIKLTPYAMFLSLFCFFLEGRLLPFRVADISHLSDLSGIDATAWIKSLFSPQIHQGIAAPFLTLQ